MASRKKTNQLSFGLRFKDERTPKLIGVFLLFLSAYLFIAFFSYLFTWMDDYDDVNSKPFLELLSDSFQASNLLGRLGAVVSNTFFWWGVGLSSFFIVYLMAVYGLAMIKNRVLRELRPLLKKCLALIIFSSILLEFIFGDATFPWGGALGEAVSAWLTSFVGVLGMIVLIITIFAALLVWFVNPDFNELTYAQAIHETKLWLLGLFNKRYSRNLKGRTSRDINQDILQEPEKDYEITREKDSDSMDFELKDGNGSIKTQSGKQGNADFEIHHSEPHSGPSESEEATSVKAKATQASLFPEMQGTQGTENFSEPYDPTLELSSYEYPTLSLLNDYHDQKLEVDRAELEANKDQIVETLLNYKIEIVKIRATIGPTVTLYEIIPAPGVRISRIKNLEDDIALSLSALGIRIIAPIPGRGTIGIEVPNKNKQIVALKEVLMSDKFKRAKMDLPIALGKTIANEVFVVDLAKMPHLLIAGATGQGKSVGINAVLLSILYKKHPSQVKIALIDPKKVELFAYSKIRDHFLAFMPDQEEPITTDTTRVIHTLNSLCIEMETRYNLMKIAHVRNITEYNEKFISRRLNPNNGHRFLPFIVLVIDEFADLIMTAGKEIELPIGRLAQLARAVGIHLIIATQRPSVNIITGVIKANFPARIAYKVSAKVDSRTILDASGAEQLVGQGDMLLSVGGDMIRLQCAFVGTEEMDRVIKFISDQKGYPEPYYLPEFNPEEGEMGGGGMFDPSEIDEMMEDAARLVVQSQHGSTSMIQRRLKLGYNRAGRIMDQLEAIGVVGPAEGSKPREVLVYDEVELERYLDNLRNRK
jgi:S-DNA-T family DNA segregation ATPase FtsK/SpoIIIE